MAAKVRYAAVAVVGMVAASVLGWWWQSRPQGPQEAGGAGAQATPAASAPRVFGAELAPVEAVPLQDDAQAVGTLRSRQGVVLRPEVAGRVLRLGFADGARVRRGQTLVQLDDSLQRAELSQAQAQWAIAQANHQRNQDLVAQNFVAQRVLDESAASLQVAQAQRDLARARLARMAITAPFDGTAGIRAVNVGDFVRDGADLVNLEDMATLYVDFRLPERFLSRLRRGQTVDLRLDAFPGRRFVARIEALDPLLDANGRSVAVRASLPNNAGQAEPGAAAVEAAPLRPGMFARATVVFAVQAQALVVPEEALLPQGGRQWVVKAVPGPDGQGLVSLRQEVTPGVRRDGRVQITQGLALGDQVVVAGQQRLASDGLPLKAVALAPAAPASTASAPAANPVR